MKRKKMKWYLAWRIFAGFFILILVFTSLHFWSLLQLRELGYHLRLLKRGFLPLTKLSSQLEAIKLNNKAETIKLYEMTPQKASLPILQRLHFPTLLLQKVSKSQSLLQNLQSQISLPDQKFGTLLQGYLQQIRETLSLYEKQLTQLKTQVTKNRFQQWNQTKEALLKTEQRLRREIRLLSLQVDFRTTQIVLNAERQEQKTVLMLLVLWFVALVVGGIVFLVNIFPLRRIRQLTEMTKQIAEGDYLQRVQIPEGDEIGMLARDFNEMAEALHHRNIALAQRRKELENAYQELQESSDKLLRSERLAAIGRIAAQITHEIRNPLNAIGLNLELLEEDLEKLNAEEDVFLVLRSSMNAVEHLTSITEDYLRLARLPSPQLEKIDLVKEIEGLFEFLSQELYRREVQWKLLFVPPIPSISIDGRQIKQALINIVRNGMEAASVYRGKESFLEIRVRVVGRYVEIRIHDNGEGISSERMPHIFTPFFSTKEEGSGLGLHLTKQIIESHEGTIECESSREQGTFFTVRLPISFQTPSNS